MIAPRKLLFVLFFAFAAVSLSSANSYFVTQSGAGSQNGSSAANAWSVASFNGSSLPTGGDTVFFSGTITSAINAKSSGTGNGASRLVYDFTAATLNIGGNEVTIDQNFVTYLGGTFIAKSSGTLFTCGTGGFHDITISGWTFVGNANGITDGVIVGTCNNLLTAGNSFDNIAHGWTAFQGRNDGNTILNNFFRTSTDTTQQDDVIDGGDSTNLTIQGNKLVNQAPGNSANSRHNDVIQAFRSGATGNTNPSNWIIRYNWIEVAQQDGTGGNMSWHEMENFAGQPALQIYGNVYVGSNVSWDGGNGISIHTGTNASDTYYFYNNTVIAHQSPLNPIRLGEGDGPGTVFFRNNAVSSDFAQTIQVTFSPGASWDHNFFNGISNCSTTYSGAHGSCSLLTSALASVSANDFAVTVGSSLINAADNTVGSAYNQGIAPGATWPNPTLVSRTAGAWDVGAYQSGGGAPSSQGPPPVAPVGLTVTVI